MTKDWDDVLIDASISIMNGLLETSKHSVIEAAAIKKTYSRVAVEYAISLVQELNKKFDEGIEI